MPRPSETHQIQPFPAPEEAPPIESGDSLARSADRPQQAVSIPPPDGVPILQVGDHSISLGPQRCYLGDNMLWRCMMALLNAGGKPVDHGDMLRLIGADSSWGGRNDIRTVVYRLRRKLCDDGLSQVARAIRNVRGAYLLQPCSDFTFCATAYPNTIGSTNGH